MKNSVAAVKSNQRLAGGIYEMRLQVPAGKEAKSPATAGVRPGQFINIKLDGHYLRRPISIFDWQDDELTIIYKVVGAGTEDMSEMKAGSELDYSDRKSVV